MAHAGFRVGLPPFPTSGCAGRLPVGLRLDPYIIRGIKMRREESMRHNGVDRTDSTPLDFYAVTPHRPTHLQPPVIRAHTHSSAGTLQVSVFAPFSLRRQPRLAPFLSLSLSHFFFFLAELTNCTALVLFAFRLCHAFAAEKGSC